MFVEGLVSTIIPVQPAFAVARGGLERAWANLPANRDHHCRYGSTDETGREAEALADAHPEVSAIHLENGGPGAARETGPRVACGDPLCRQNSRASHQGLGSPKNLHDITRDPWVFVQAGTRASMRIAYLIIAHDQPDHLHRMVKALDCDGGGFYIHIDNKVELSAFRPEMLEKENVHFLRTRVDVQWMGFSLVEATLMLMQEAMRETVVLTTLYF